MKIFWSWQSDTPGKTGRHFIRTALLEAIKELKEAEDVEEPTERDIRESLHLDQDRQGVSGSPDLARTILDKIDASVVFVADVTPVSTIQSKTADDEKIREKRNMNPNVAIELGYALRALSDKNVLMILNTYYGGREFLPFDLAHKGGPILFKLAPTANNKAIKEELTSLKSNLITALRPYLKIKNSATTITAPHFIEAQPTKSKAIYFEPNETLAVIGEDYDKVEYSYADSNGFYLRLIPTILLSKPIYKSDLLAGLSHGNIYPLSASNQMGLHVANNYGVISIEPGSPNGGPIKASTQLFVNGEIWGIARGLLINNEYGSYIPGKAFEDTFRKSLYNYIDFVQNTLKISPPYTVELGVVGIQGYSIAITRLETLGPFYDNELSIRLILNDTSSKALDTVLLNFFEELFRVSGYPRPRKFLRLPYSVK